MTTLLPRAIAHLIRGCPLSGNGALRPGLLSESRNDLKSSYAHSGQGSKNLKCN